MKNLYNEADKNEILNRLENLKVDAVRQWGKMKANSLLTSGESCNGSILTIICDNLERNECNATQSEVI